MHTFEELGLSPMVLKATTAMGFEEATPIQEKTIPKVMSGRDIIGQAQTGTGKTAAFGIPLVEKIDHAYGSIKGLVITPTRELAVQVAEEINRLGQFKGIRALPIYGGQDIYRQLRSLQARPQIVVGTPGRLMDHLRRKTVRLQQATMVIIDEADEMLNMGFIEDVETILQEVPQERQTLLFSATMPLPIQALAQRFMSNPEYISIKSEEVTVPNTEQNYIEVQEKQKLDVLCRLLDIQPSGRAIVFGRTKRRVDELFEALSKRGYSAEGIHGDLTQSKRDSVLRHFKEGITEILVATDVAARGLDISDVQHVYNFDIPQDAENYVHRIGRTGRAGKPGQATTFVTPREIGHLKLIEQMIRKRIVRKPLPTLNEAVENQQRIVAEKLNQVIGEGNILQFREFAEELLTMNDSVTLVSAALKLLIKEPDLNTIKLTEELPFGWKQPRKEPHRKFSQRRGPNEKGGRTYNHRQGQY